MEKDTTRRRSGSPRQEEENSSWEEEFLGALTARTPTFSETPTAISPNVGGTPTDLTPAFSLDPDEVLNSSSFPFDVDEGRESAGAAADMARYSTLSREADEAEEAQQLEGPEEITLSAQDNEEGITTLAQQDEEEFTSLPGEAVEAVEYQEAVEAVESQEAVEDEQMFIQLTSGRRRKRRTNESHDVVLETEAGLWWAPTSEGPWHRATFFTDEVRRDFLEEMGELGSFEYPRPAGPGPLDQTAYHPGQRTWGGDRPDRPDILFQHHPSLLAKAQRQAQNVFEFLMHKDRIVIDPESRRPIRNFPELPKTISSQEPGWSLEAMSRLNEWINMDDFRDRMPHEHRPTVRSLSMRRSRFRWNAGLLAWTPREGSKAIKEYLESKLPKICLETNSTRSFRDLYEEEREEMKEASRGKYPERKRKEKRAEKSENSRLKKEKKGKDLSRPASRARSRSPHRERAIAHQASVQSESAGLQHEKGKEKAPAAEQDPELLLEQAQEPYDWREQAPDEHEDIRVVHYALMPARYQFIHLTGLAPPFPSNQRRSYNEQYAELQQMLEGLWYQRWGVFQEAPRLHRHQPWWHGFPQELLEEVWQEPQYQDPTDS
ncbi:MAG: hypothetical protein Q9191_003402 [Dirinaria sp. TL-2023a]